MCPLALEHAHLKSFHDRWKGSAVKVTFRPIPPGCGAARKCAAAQPELAWSNDSMSKGNDANSVYLSSNSSVSCGVSILNKISSACAAPMLALPPAGDILV